VKFSPPVNRAVTSADVKYAMERDFNPAVGNGYAGAYWGDIIGSKPYAAGKAKEISGIQTPDPQTLVIHLARPTAAIVIGAMALPGTAPVPQDYAAKFDKGAHSTYSVDASATASALDILALFGTGTESGGATYHARVEPGLTLKARKSGGRVTFTVTDAGDPVSGARVKTGGLVGRTNSKGQVKLALRRGTATATKTGYEPAKVRVR